MLLLLAIVLFIAWFIGLLAHVAGGFVHLLLIAVVVMVVLHFLKD